VEHPGVELKQRFLDPLGITPYQLAKGTGVQQTRISQIIQGKRRITADTAVRLGAFFGVPGRWFLEMQMRFDLERAEASVPPIARHPGRYWVRPTGAKPLGSAPAAKPTTLIVDDELRARVQKQAALAPARIAREVIATEYEDGTRAIVGKREDA
jgi:addiction module HigA family antidote